MSKAPKKKQEKKKTSMPTVLQEALGQRTPRNQAMPTAAATNGQRSAPPPINKKRSPPMPRKKSPPMPFQKRKSQEEGTEGGTKSRQQPPPPSGPPPPVASKPTGNMSYAELNFSPGGGGEFTDDGKSSVGGSRMPPGSSGNNSLSHSGEGDAGAIPHDPKTKYGYSTILFDEQKQKDIIAAERLKRERGAPPPIPDKYQGGGNKAKKLRQYVSDSSTTMASSLQPKEQRFQGKARPISAGTSRTPAAGRGIQNGVNSASNSSSYGDYEVMDDEFYEEEEEFENVPRKPRSADGATTSTNGTGRGGGYATPPPLPSRQIASGYEIVELEINDDRGGRSIDRQNQPLPPLPSREQSSRPQQLLARSTQQNGGAPQPKPRFVKLYII